MKQVLLWFLLLCATIMIGWDTLNSILEYFNA